MNEPQLAVIFKHKRAEKEKVKQKYTKADRTHSFRKFRHDLLQT